MAMAKSSARRASLAAVLALAAFPRRLSGAVITPAPVASSHDTVRILPCAAPSLYLIWHPLRAAEVRSCTWQRACRFAPSWAGSECWSASRVLAVRSAPFRNPDSESFTMSETLCCCPLPFLICTSFHSSSHAMPSVAPTSALYGRMIPSCTLFHICCPANVVA